MQLSTILSSKGDFVATITPESTVGHLVSALAQHHVGALVVSRDGRQVDGIVSERDVVRSLTQGQEALSRTVAEIMTDRVFTARPQAHVDELLQVMTDNRFRHIPVTDDDGTLIGIVSIGDIVKMRLGELEGERAALMEYITQS